MCKIIIITGVFPVNLYLIFSLWAIHVSPFLSVLPCSITLLSCRWTLSSSVSMATRACSIVVMSSGALTSCSFMPDENGFIPKLNVSPKPPGVGVGWCLILLSAAPDGTTLPPRCFNWAFPSWLLRRSICRVAFNLVSLSTSSSLSSSNSCCSLRFICSACALHTDSMLCTHCWHVALASLSTWDLRWTIPPQHCFRDSSSMFCLIWESSKAMKSLSQREMSAVLHGVGVSPGDPNHRKSLAIKIWSITIYL